MNKSFSPSRPDQSPDSSRLSSPSVSLSPPNPRNGLFSRPKSAENENDNGDNYNFKNTNEDDNKSKKVNDNNDKDQDEGFIPSFYDPGRQPRARRGVAINLTSNDGGGSSTLDQLDLALGFGSTTAKKVSDPFANATTSRFSTINKINTKDEITNKSKSSKYDSDDSDSESDNSKASKSIVKKDNIIDIKVNNNTDSTTKSRPLSANSIRNTVTPQIHVKSNTDSGKSNSITSAPLPSLKSTSSNYPVIDDNSKVIKLEEVDKTVNKANDKNSLGIDTNNTESDDELDISGIVKEIDINTLASPSSRNLSPSSRSTINRRGNSSSFRSEGGTNSPTNQAEVSPKQGLNPAWLTSKSSSTNNQTNFIATTLSTTTKYNNDNYNNNPTTSRDERDRSLSPNKEEAAVRLLRQKLEANQLEREAVERNLRLEVETLKYKLLQSQNIQTTSVDNEQLKEFQEGCSILHREKLDLNRQIIQYELEIAKLKDEANLKSLRHHEEIKYNKDRHEYELNEIEKRNQEGLKLIETRHEVSVAALKKIHLEDIQSIRDRVKDGVALEQISNQLKSSSGSIKLIEEQLHARYRGLDVAREAQMEARERLITDMEQKAKERVDNAENEGYRLKGLLIHMENMVATLRSQNGEEKERLRQEQFILQSMQSSLESEKSLMQSRVTEELLLLKKHLRDTDEERKLLLIEKKEFNELQATSLRKLEMDKAEFATYIASSTRAIEVSSSKLKEEEERLSRIRDTLQRDKNILEQRKNAAISEIQEAEKLRASMLQYKNGITHEKQLLRQAAKELHNASEEVARREEMLNEQETLIQKKQQALNEGMIQMKNASIDLSQRESSTLNSLKILENQQLLMSKQDQSLQEKKLSMAVLQRELMQKQIFEAISTSNNNFSSINNDNNENYVVENIIEEEKTWMSEFKLRLKQKDNNINNNNNNVIKEIKHAKKSLNSARSHLSYYSPGKKYKNFLEDEGNFISHLSKSK